jgi:hypothetical protein
MMEFDKRVRRSTGADISQRESGEGVDGICHDWICKTGNSDVMTQMWVSGATEAIVWEGRRERWQMIRRYMGMECRRKRRKSRGRCPGIIRRRINKP